jgi:NAD(P)-dependent dehydrogenase (short-subunit alcohol dehydrogenase family)
MSPLADWQGVKGKQVLITGATAGIGLAAAVALAARGAKIAFVARSEERSRDALKRIKAAAGSAPVDVLLADLSSQASVRRLADQALQRYNRIDVLINNAGGVYPERKMTEDEIELTWAINHLAPFLLTTILLDRIKSSAPARIITTSSAAHKVGRVPFDDFDAAKSYSSFKRYGDTKLANILFTRELASRLGGTNVTASCFHPGTVATSFGRDSAFLRGFMKLAGPFIRTPEKGAETLVWLADSREAAGQNGGYYYDMKRLDPAPAGRDDDAARKLWDASEQQTIASSRFA